MGEKRSIGSHMYNIGIALVTCHNSSLSKSSLKNILSLWSRQSLFFHMTSIFSSKDFRSLTAIVVITGYVFHKPILITIEVLINEVSLQSCHLFPSISELLAILIVRTRTTTTDNLDIRVLRTDSRDKFLQTFGIQRSPLFVADTYQLEVKWNRMPHVGTKLTPLSGHVAVCELNEVERIVDIALQIINGNMNACSILVIVLELAGQADTQHRQSLRAKIL